jgi:hypothetical protein
VCKLLLLLNVISSSAWQPCQAFRPNLTALVPPSGQQCEIQIPTNYLLKKENYPFNFVQIPNEQCFRNTGLELSFICVGASLLSTIFE